MSLNSKDIEPINSTDLKPEDISISEPLDTSVFEPVDVSISKSMDSKLMENVINNGEDTTIPTFISICLNSIDLSFIRLTETEFDLMKQIIMVSPDSFNNINNCILEIIKDGKLDALDLPPLIKIIKNIYILSHEQINIKIHNLIETIGNILKYIIQIALIKNNNCSPDLIRSLNGIIDIAIEMIQLHSSFKKKFCFFKLC